MADNDSDLFLYPEEIADLVFDSVREILGGQGSEDDQRRRVHERFEARQAEQRRNAPPPPPGLRERMQRAAFGRSETEV